MKTLLIYPPPRSPQDEPRDLGVVFWSRFPDVVGLWTALGEEPQPEEVRE